MKTESRIAGYGAILYASDDPQRVLDVARCLQAQSVECQITPGIDTLYAIRAVERARFEDAYVRWRKEFDRWAHERFGVRP